MDKKHDLVCDQCGGMMTLSENRREMHCEYCGNVVILPDKEHEEKVAYAKRKAELDAQHEHYEKRKRMEHRHLNVSKLIALLVVASIFLIPASCVAGPYIFRPTINPFEYIDVKFEGINGEGKATVELIQSNNWIQSLDDLNIKLSQSYYLSENDIISITTNDSTSPCRHNVKYMEYTVKGLELFLTGLDDIDEYAEKLIHQKSRQLIGKTINDNPQFSTPKHEKFYLLSDKDKENVLYDVYSCKWELIEGYSKTVYLVAYYTDIIVHNGANATFSYEDCMYTGNLLYEGSYSNGYVYGYESLEDIELDLNTNHSPDMVLTEK
ncbi:MAG: hypothetical protein IKK10_02360 [Clostridia bacterium]|nr:hypothetical protein [Clostridia bacterium]